METIASRYRIEERIGGGGEAQVYRARDLVTGGDVAVRLSPGADFPAPESEMPVLHCGWVRLLGRGVDPAQGAYAVFELLEGETLGALTAHGPLAHGAWLDFARQSLNAIGALHRARWVHGDVNADNFLFETGTTWKLLELPFHHAVPVEKRPPTFGSIYTLSPEQLSGRPPDARSDLYALGCLYYKAASGNYPHAGGNAAEIAVGRLRFSPAALGEIAPDFPVAWAGWIMRLLERDPAERPADAGAARRLLDVAVNRAS